MMMHGGSGISGAEFLMPVAMVVFGAMLITAFVLTVRYLVSSPRTGAGAAGELIGAERLLAQRFSRGEIDDDEYRQKLTLLHRHRQNGGSGHDVAPMGLRAIGFPAQERLRR